MPFRLFLFTLMFIIYPTFVYPARILIIMHIFVGFHQITVCLKSCIPLDNFNNFFLKLFVLFKTGKQIRLCKQNTSHLTKPIKF